MMSRSRPLKMSERTGRNSLSGLLREGLMTAKSEKGAVHLGFPAQIAVYWPLELYPQKFAQNSYMLPISSHISLFAKPNCAVK